MPLGWVCALSVRGGNEGTLTVINCWMRDRKKLDASDRLAAISINPPPTYQAGVLTTLSNPSTALVREQQVSRRLHNRQPSKQCDDCCRERR
jgi:hypothetical protein